ncbi:MAG: hypothetical protein ABFS03_11875, partial [Chloroflexota bacterium]
CKGLPESVLKPTNRDVFRHFAATFSFTRNEQGVLTGIAVSAWQARNIVFIKESNDQSRV